MNNLCERLRYKRNKLGLTQARLAELSKTKQQTIQLIESGQTKRPRCLFDLALALKCDPMWLMYGDSPKKHEQHVKSFSHCDLEGRP